jgi:hypothetical protein
MELDGLQEIHGDYLIYYVKSNEGKNKSIKISHVRRRLKLSIDLEEGNTQMVSVNPIEGYNYLDVFYENYLGILYCWQ